MDSREDLLENLRLDDRNRYYVFVSVGYCNSQATPYLLTGHSPIHICEELPAHIPDDFIYIPPAGSDGDPFVRKASASSDRFYRSITSSGFIQQVFDELISRQGSLMVKTFRNSPAFSPQFEKKGIKCFGLTPEQAHRFNSKTEQTRLLEGVLPFPKHIITKAKDAPAYFPDIRSDRGVFISREYGGGGSGSRLAGSRQELERHVSSFSPEEQIVMSELLSLQACPSIDVMIANPDEVLAYGIADQIFDPENPLGCLGSVYPSGLPAKTLRDIEELAIMGGRRLAEEGLRGYVSFDFNVDDRGRVLFGEMNARYTGNTSERMLAMELTRPSDHPTVMDLERMAIENGTFAGHRLWQPPSQLHYIKREVAAQKEGMIAVDLELPHDERAIFVENGGGIVGRLEKGAHVEPGVSIGKIVCVSSSRKDCEMIAGELGSLAGRMVE